MQRTEYAELYEIIDNMPIGNTAGALNSLIDLQYALSAMKHKMEIKKANEERETMVRIHTASQLRMERKQAYEERVIELRKKFQFYKCGELPFAINQYILDFITTPYISEYDKYMNAGVFLTNLNDRHAEEDRLREANIKWCRERNHLCRDDYNNAGLSAHPSTAWQQILNHTFKKTFVAKYFEYVRDGLRKMHIVDLRVIQKGIFAYNGKTKMEVANHVFQNLLCGGNVDYAQSKPMKKKQVLKVILAIKRMDKRGRVIGGINYYDDHRHNYGQFKPTPYKYVEAEADSDDDGIDM
jgi:hypothetical protein